MWKTITYKFATTRRLAGLLGLAGVVCLMALPAHAGSSSTFLSQKYSAMTEQRHEGRTWQMVQRADVLPLETVLGIARREIGGGELLEVDLNDRTGVYRLKMLRPNDSVVDVIVDGKTGRVLRVRGQ